MLAPPSIAGPPPPERLTQRVPFPRHDAGGIDPCAVAGEDAPAWLAIAFAIAGTMIAMASAELSLQSFSAQLRTATVATVPAEPPRPRVDPPAERQPVAQQDIRPPEPPRPPQPAEARPAPATVAAQVAPETPPAPVVVPEAKTTLSVTEPPAPKPTPTECFQPLTIAFDRNSSRPDPSDMRRSLEVLHRWLPRHGEATVLIEGHSDTTGTEDYNLLLSYARAKAIAGELKRVGVPAKQIAVRAAGAGEAPSGRGTGSASERSAILRMAGVEECGRPEAAAKKP
ncbi:MULTISPECIES: OmpA family protein [unclassified Bradyrhizobium]|uniref:OmpA family protein n=1 Tax=unclassified Bradyrhizobium TaxID=2631580 RepID=UPI002916B9C5|nr:MULTISPECIES: OmpA family protein [unclassified Bradyrhizobium]